MSLEGRVPVEQANVKSWGRTPLREERTKPSAACEHPERWTAIDDVNPEIEVLKFIRSLVRTVKPERVVTVGDPTGELSRYIGQALRENGCGRLTVCGVAPEAYDTVFGRIVGSGLARWVEVLEDGARDTGGELPFVVIDGKPEQVQKDINQFLPLVIKGGFLVAHDTASLEGIEYVPWGDPITLPTPRGLTIFQRK